MLNSITEIIRVTEGCVMIIPVTYGGGNVTWHSSVYMLSQVSSDLSGPLYFTQSNAGMTDADRTDKHDLPYIPSRCKLLENTRLIVEQSIYKIPFNQ